MGSLLLFGTSGCVKPMGEFSLLEYFVVLHAMVCCDTPADLLAANMTDESLYLPS